MSALHNNGPPNMFVPTFDPSSVGPPPMGQPSKAISSRPPRRGYPNMMANNAPPPVADNQQQQQIPQEQNPPVQEFVPVPQMQMYPPQPDQNQTQAEKQQTMPSYGEVPDQGFYNNYDPNANTMDYGQYQQPGGYQDQYYQNQPWKQPEDSNQQWQQQQEAQQSDVANQRQDQEQEPDLYRNGDYVWNPYLEQWILSPSTGSAPAPDPQPSEQESRENSEQPPPSYSSSQNHHEEEMNRHSEEVGRESEERAEVQHLNREVVQQQQQQNEGLSSSNSNNPPDVANAGSHCPPDILLNDPFIPSSERNLYMQTGQLAGERQPSVEGQEEEHQQQVNPPNEEREPVDGGNEEFGSVPPPPSALVSTTNNQEVDDLPLDRLVLGQSDQLQAVVNNPPQQQQPMDNNLIPPVQDRVVMGNNENEDNNSNMMSPVKPVHQQQVIMTSTPTYSAGKKSNEENAVEEDNHNPEIRSEAVGSDRRDESVMGPPPSGPAPPSGPRNVAGADGGSSRNAPAPLSQSSSINNNNSHVNKKVLDSDPDERLSEYSRESDRLQKRRLHGDSSHPHSSRRARSRSRESSSEERDSSEERYRRKGSYRDKQRGEYYNREDSPPRRGHRGHKDKSMRHYDDRPPQRHRDGRDGDRTFRDENNKSYRGNPDDRSYYDDNLNYSRRSESGRYNRGPKYDDRRDYYPRESSRPSSRSGSIYEERFFDRERYAREYVMYGGYRNMPQYMQMQSHFAPPVAHQVLPDRAAMDTFEKHWKYYIQHPQLYEQMRLQNPAQYESLNNYYKMCGEYLRLPPIVPVPIKQEQVQEQISSRASVHSGQSSDSALVQSGGPDIANASKFHAHNRPGSSRGGGEESAIYQDPDADPHYLPTFVQTPGMTEESHHRITPVKFASPHVKATFGARGILAKVNAKSPLEGQSAQVEFHSLQTVLATSALEFQNYPGPLVPGSTHKGEVIQFCQSKIQAANQSNSRIVDRESYCLLWELLVLLLRQKNAIDGSDIAELLMKGRTVTGVTDHVKALPTAASQAVIADDNDGSVIRHDRTLILSSKQEEEKVTMKFRDYLMFGHKKEGLEYAMNHGLWGHALFLASKMDERSYSNVMLRFANGLAVNDPLQTLYQLMSGRQPIAVKECADKNWGDWRPHLAMILSNPSSKEGLDRRSIMTLGDTLLDKGFLYASHFCYLMANAEFGAFTDANSKIVLIGSDRTLPFDQFATIEAIQCTEIFEYIQKLSNPEYALMSFQYLKFVYAVRLIDQGMSGQALHYFEQIALTLTKNYQHIVGDRLHAKEFVNQVYTLADRLKYLDPVYTTREGEVSDMSDPEWLQSFKNVVYSIGESYQAHHEVDHGHNYEHEQNYDQHYQQQQEEYQNYLNQNEAYYDGAQEPIMMKPIPEESQLDSEHANTVEPQDPTHESSAATTTAASSLQPSPQHTAPPPMFPTNTNSQHHQAPVSDPTTMPPMPSSGGNDSNYFSNIRSKVDNSRTTPPVSSVPPPTAATKGEDANNKKPNGDLGKSDPKKPADGPGMLGRFLGRFIKPPNQAHLPDDKNQGIVWDEETKKWIDKSAGPEEETTALAAPPSDMDLMKGPSQPPMSGGVNGPPPPMMVGGGNKFAGGLAKKRGGLAGRIDIFKNSQSAPVLNDGGSGAPPPMPSLPPMAPMEPVIPLGEAAQHPPPKSPDHGANETAADGGAPPMFFNPNNF